MPALLCPLLAPWRGRAWRDDLEAGGTRRLRVLAWRQRTVVVPWLLLFCLPESYGRVMLAWSRRGPRSRFEVGGW